MTELFAIIPVTQPAPADAIVVGSMSAVMECLPQTVARNEAEEQLERQRITADQIASMQSKTRVVQASMLADSIANLSTRLDTFVQRKDDAKQEAEAKRIADELAALPDIDDPATHGHMPGGELHTVAAKVEYDPDETEDDAGGVPLSYGTVPLSYVHSEDEADARPRRSKKTKGTAFPQPTAIGFDGA